MPPKHLVLWDGECGFCRRCVQFLARHDRFHRLEFCPYQEAELSPGLREACKHAMHVIKANGEVIRAGRAAMFCGQFTRWNQLARIAQWPIFLPFIEVGYKIVAANRGLFSKVFFRSGK